MAETPAVTLYGPSMSPFVQKVVRALFLKKLDFALVEPSAPEDYRRWNPETGLLPVVDVGATRVPDSVAILDLLDERFPEPPLQSSEPKAASAQRRLESWVGETFYFYWVNRLRQGEGGEESQGGPGARGLLSRLGVLRRDRSGEGAAPDRLAAEFERRLDDLVNFLGGRPFYYADRVNRADLAAFAFLQTLRNGVVSGGLRLLNARPELLEHMARVEQETGQRSS